ncbi:MULTISPECIES: hypothetical protein [Halolamina]|uniref:Uncharacterized protein n=1 Tax=Halolamina pelagica TaxID=699431 RepID=A0A1I5SLI7_9EURY|nr:MULTISPECIES: hypothetical protein [Halolamina]NHX37000.1 hypothetical protein [Halolamina sp. R1-12]SFP71605.1 hypothetical protein SAMN05216277_106180 [Halolamina pelagica]
MDRRRVALLLVVVGLLCLPAPYYLGWAAEATSPPAQSSQIYVAEPVDLDNASDRKQFVDAHGHEVALADYRITARYSDEYRAPNATLDALVTAMREGSASVDDPDARADLRGIDAEYEFVRDTNENTEPDGYYRLTVADDGATVRAENVSDRAVANAIAERAPRYGNLSAGEQRTVDRVLENSTGDDLGYRPRVNEPYVDQFPTAIRKGDTLYSVTVYGHVDDFGPGFGGFVVGLGVAAVGVVLVIVGGGLYAYDRWSG